MYKRNQRKKNTKKYFTNQTSKNKNPSVVMSAKLKDCVKNILNHDVSNFDVN